MDIYTYIAKTNKTKDLRRHRQNRSSNFSDYEVRSVRHRIWDEFFHRVVTDCKREMTEQVNEPEDNDKKDKIVCYQLFICFRETESTDKRRDTSSSQKLSSYKCKGKTVILIWDIQKELYKNFHNYFEGPDPKEGR